MFSVSWKVVTYFAASAAMASRRKTLTPGDINVFHCSYAHANNPLLRITARELGISLTSSLKTRVDTCTDEDIKIVRYHEAGKFRGMLSKVCANNWIKQGFTTPDTPLYNGVAERGLALMKDELTSCEHSGRRTFSDRVCPEDEISVGRVQSPRTCEKSPLERNACP